MFLYGEDTDVRFFAASNNLLDFVQDTQVGITGCVGKGPNVVCCDIESLIDVWCSSDGVWIRDMASDCSALTMLRHGEIAL